MLQQIEKKKSAKSLIWHSFVTFSITCEKVLAEEGGFEPPVQLPVRQFSKLVVSATHPSFRLASANIRGFILSTKFF